MTMAEHDADPKGEDMEAEDMKGQDRFAAMSRPLLRRTRQLSLQMLAITAVTCVATSCVAWLPGTTRLLKLIMATNTLLIAWGNRRALLETKRFRILLDDERLASERKTLLATMWVDRISLSVAVVTFLYIMHAALQASWS